MPKQATEKRVVIVGAGPTGLALAGELALAGVTCRVLERREHPSAESRALALHARTLEMLDLRGQAERFVQEGFPCRYFPLGTRQARLDFAYLPSRFPYLLIIAQSRIEQFLEERARALGVEVIRQARVVDLAQDETGVSIQVEGAQVKGAGRSWTERASYMVGCDGVHSTVRQLLGIAFPGSPNAVAVTLADVRLPAMAEPQPLGHFSDKGLMLAFPFGSSDQYRVVLYDYERAGVPVTEPVTLTEVRAGLQRILGTDLGACDPVWLTRYRSEQRQAEHYRMGRIFLAGDAAHSHAPTGAQGLNIGFQDAMNLGWKLAADVHGWAPPNLLDSYHSERYPIAAQVLRTTKVQLRLNTARSLPLRVLRALAFAVLTPLPAVQRLLSKRLSGLAFRYPPPVGEPASRLVGRRIADGSLTVQGGHATRLYQLFQDGQFVLVDRSATAEFATIAEQGWTDRVRAVAATSHEIRWPFAMLIRPDGYVAWASENAGAARHEDAVQTALRRWCGEPNHPA